MLQLTSALFLLPLLAQASTVNIDVGANGALVYSPANITAAIGTLVTFSFAAGAIPHSVSQSSFADPCTPLTGSNGTGFDSGLQTAKQFTINITDNTIPIWFFCKTPSHCGRGMVGSINAPQTGNKTFEAFHAAAVAIGSSEVTVPDKGYVPGAVGAVALASPAATGSSSATGSSTATGSSSPSVTASPTPSSTPTGSSTATVTHPGSSTPSTPSSSPTTSSGAGSSGSDASRAVVAVSGALGFVAALAAFGLLA